jgi:hypothetical protein
LKGVRDNMRAGIASMKEHSVPVRQIALANRAPEPAGPAEASRGREEGRVLLDASDIFERGFYASRLRRDNYWRKELLGLSSEPVTLPPAAPDLAESRGDSFPWWPAART